MAEIEIIFSYCLLFLLSALVSVSPDFRLLSLTGYLPCTSKPLSNCARVILHLLGISQSPGSPLGLAGQHTEGPLFWVGRAHPTLACFWAKQKAFSLSYPSISPFYPHLMQFLLCVVCSLCYLPLFLGLTLWKVLNNNITVLTLVKWQKVGSLAK